MRSNLGKRVSLSILFLVLIFSTSIIPLLFQDEIEYWVFNTLGINYKPYYTILFSIFCTILLFVLTTDFGKKSSIPSLKSKDEILFILKKSKDLLQEGDLKNALKYIKTLRIEGLDLEIDILDKNLEYYRKISQEGVLPYSEIESVHLNIFKEIASLLNNIESAFEPISTNQDEDTVSNIREPELNYNATPLPPFNPPQKSIDELGKFTFWLPNEMTLRLPYRCIIRIAEFTTPDHEIIINENTPVERTRIGQIMKVELTEEFKRDFFDISSLSDTEQIIDEYGYTEWLFSVMPLMPGLHNLIIKVSIITIIDEKREKVKNINVLERKVEVLTTPLASQVTSGEFIIELKNLVSRGDTDGVITKLIDHFEVMNETLYSEILLISGRYQLLSRKVRLGTIASTEAGVEQNLINEACLGLINQL